MGEDLIVLTRPKYDLVARLTQSTMARPDCAVPSVIPKPPPDNSVWIFENDEAITQSCVMPQASACPYLFAVMRLPRVNWTSKELGLIRDFIEAMSCRYIPESK